MYFSRVINFILISVFFMPNFSWADQDKYSSKNRRPAAIYIMWIEDGGKIDDVYKPHYIGQVRGRGGDIEDMVEKRFKEHLREPKFIEQIDESQGDIWRYDIIVSSDVLGNKKGWTSLETGLNEQGYITHYCYFDWLCCVNRWN